MTKPRVFGPTGPRPWHRTKRWRATFVAALVLFGPWVLLGIKAAFVTLPPELVNGGPEQPAPPNSIRYVDRTGVVLADRRDAEGERHRRLTLAEIGLPMQRAILAAEDTRFYFHAGVDPLAVARALVTSVFEGRVVSGASTLTQQLARTMTGTSRTLSGKLDVMALAIRIEAELPKDRILEEYLNRVEFGPKVRGAEAAAWTYFDKPARDLSLGEAAALASIPRGPTLYDPNKNPKALHARRDRVLERMLGAGFATFAEVQRAKAEDIVVSGRFRRGSAPHFVQAIASGRLDPCSVASAIPDGTVQIETTLLADLQDEIEQAARRTVADLEEHAATAASVVVLDNASGEVLAYVGSPDVNDLVHLGANDGVLAARQPGSALKPFVYELAMDRLGMTPATMLPDVEMSFPTSDGDAFRPRNYDHAFHGPVLMREALGSSLNVPAVWLTERLGAGNVLERLREVGFCSLTQAASHYGLAISLGDGEVTLMELAAAYASLARGGQLVRPRGVLGYVLANGEHSVSTGSAETQKKRPHASFIVDILRDPRARAASFGESTVFDLPFPVAAKTGTSKGFRDNWAVGFTPSLTVAVWVGNFDGSPMRDVSGIEGAGPLFRAAMLAAERAVSKRGDDARTDFALEGAQRTRICSLSGKRAGPSCKHVRSEVIPKSAKLEACDMHVAVLIDKKTGERAGAACTDDVEERTFESYPPLLVGWARAANRPLPPDSFSLRCPGDAVLSSSNSLRILYPEDGARFFLTPGQASFIEARATFPLGAPGAGFQLDGRSLPPDPRGITLIELKPGRHSLVAITDGSRSDPVTLTVE